MMKTVKNKFQTEGGLAVIYLIDDLFMWFSTEQDPYFRKGEMISLERAKKTNHYKVRKYEGEIPPDAYIDLIFSWS